MRIIDELKDIFEIMKNQKFNLDISLTPEQEEILKLVENLKSGVKEPVALRTIKNFKDKMENWIYDNLEYPINLPNFYESVIRTFTNKTSDKELISFIVFSYPEKIKKMMDYEKNKDIDYIDHPVLNLIRPSANNNYEQKYQNNNSQGFKNSNQNNHYHNSKKTNEVKKESVEDETKKEIKLSEIKKEINDKQRNDNLSKYSSYLKRTMDIYLNYFIQSLGFNIFDNENEIKDEEIKKKFSEQKKVLNNMFLAKIHDLHSRLLNGYNQTEEDIIKDYLLPFIVDLTDDEFKTFSVLYKIPENQKLDVSYTISTGKFWSSIKQMSDEKKSFLSTIFKLNSYNQESNFKSVFNTLAMISVKEDVFKERLFFLESLGFSTTNNKVFAYSARDNLNFLKAVTTNENEITRLNPEEGRKFTLISVADLLLKENNPNWNKVLNEIKKERQTKKMNRFYI